MLIEYSIYIFNRDGLVHYEARVARCQSVVSSSPIKGYCCFLEPETLHSLLSTGCGFQERTRAQVILNKNASFTTELN